MDFFQSQINNDKREILKRYFSEYVTQDLLLQMIREDYFFTEKKSESQKGPLPKKVSGTIGLVMHPTSYIN